MGTQKRARIRHDKRAIGVRGNEVRLSNGMKRSWKLGKLAKNGRLPMLRSEVPLMLWLVCFSFTDVSHQTLDDVMQACLDDKFMSKKDWINVCWFLAICLQDMHEFGVLHNNLRTDNILIEFRDKPVNIYFTDLRKATFRRGSMLPLNYEIECNDFQKDHLAPEVCQYMPSSPESDIYSLGKVFEEIDKHCNCLTSLLYHMCRADPDDRLTIKEVMEILYILLTEDDQ